MKEKEKVFCSFSLPSLQCMNEISEVKKAWKKANEKNKTEKRLVFRFNKTRVHFISLVFIELNTALFPFSVRNVV